MGLEVREQVALAPLTTMGVGGAARFFVEVRTESALEEAMEWARVQAQPVFVLGGGSNLLVRDEGYPGLVLRVAIEGAMTRARVADRVEVTVAAGMPWETMVDAVCAEGLSGVECLAGIPGSTGASPVQNIGAYGQEVSQTVRRVRVWDRQHGRFETVAAESCGFGYRRSIFNGSAAGRYVITAVTFALEPGGRAELSYAELRRHFAEEARPEPTEVAKAVRAIRRGKGMVVVPGEADSRSAGSFFKNPVVAGAVLDRVAAAAEVEVSAVPHWPVPTVDLDAATGADRQRLLAEVKLSAAWLVERAGFGKGFALGAAGISSRHSLALINRTGEATYAEIASLRDAVRAAVRERFGVELEQEPMELGPETVDRFAHAFSTR